MLCKWVSMPVKFRKQASKISSSLQQVSCLSHFPVSWQLSSLGRRCQGSWSAWHTDPWQPKFWGFPGLKALTESAMQAISVKGKDASSADAGDSKCFGFPPNCEISKSSKAQNRTSLHRFLVLDKSLITLIRDCWMMVRKAVRNILQW